MTEGMASGMYGVNIWNWLFYKTGLLPEGYEVIPYSGEHADLYKKGESIGNSIPIIYGAAELLVPYLQKMMEKAPYVEGAGSKIVGNSSEVTNLLDNMPELTGSTREKLLSIVQNSDLSKIVNELYRPGATVGDGGTASKLVQEFYEGSSTHLIKAQQRLNQLDNLAKSGRLGLNDLDILEALRNDLINAINLFQ